MTGDFGFYCDCGEQEVPTYDQALIAWERHASNNMDCRYCGLALVRSSGHMFTAPDRDVAPTSVLGIDCNDGECLNDAQQVTRHHPVEWP